MECRHFKPKEGAKVWVGMRCTNCGNTYKTHISGVPAIRRVQKN